MRWRRGGRAFWLGALAVLAGVGALLLGAWSWSGGQPIGVSISIQLLALTAVTGGSMAAVVLAHWYLVTPRISERPLILTTQLLMLALVIQLLLFGAWLAAGIPGMEPFEALTGDNMIFVWLRLVVGLIFPLVLTWMAYRTALTRSMESATGLLYIEFALVMASTIVATGDPRRWGAEIGVSGIVRAPDFHKWGRPDPEPADVALRELEEVIMYEGPQNIAAFILEPIVGTNGILIPPDGYLQGVRELCDKHGIMLIADEVMSGFGRTGEWFAVDHWGVVPD